MKITESIDNETKTFEIEIEMPDQEGLVKSKFISSTAISIKNILLVGALTSIIFTVNTSSTATVTGNVNGLYSKNTFDSRVNAVKNSSPTVALFRDVKNKMSSITSGDNIMNPNSTFEREESMLETGLILQRNKLERAGLFASISFSVLTIGSSMMTITPWSASLPAAFLSLSLVGFILLRRALRRGRA